MFVDILAIIGFFAAIRFISTRLKVMRLTQLSQHYEIPLATVSNDFDEFITHSRASGLKPTMRGYEVALRVRLSRLNPDTKYIKPVFCAAIDPINAEGIYVVRA